MDEKLHVYLPGVPGNSRERIQDLLRENEMTQAELAEKIGMSESALSRIYQRADGQAIRRKHRGDRKGLWRHDRFFAVPIGYSIHDQL